MAWEEKEKFIKKWGFEKIKNLELDEYTSTGGNQREDFTYDLEHNTPDIGSIRGGDSSKFKIYCFGKESTKKYIKHDEKYAWHQDLGSDSETVFEKVKNEILEIIKFAQSGEFDKIEKLKLFGDGVKWKIAFLYADEGKLVDIFSRHALLELVPNKKNIYEIQNELVDKKPVEKTMFEYSKELWAETPLSKNSAKNKDTVEIPDIENSEENPEIQNSKLPLNQILYGPPGTGKTYQTLNKALEIIFEKEKDKNKSFKLDVNGSKRELTINDMIKMDENKKEYRDSLKSFFEYYKQNSQIEFVTFHQSYGYEEFVEGIKAQTVTDSETNKKTITYDIEAGVFKELCDKAKNIKSENRSIYHFNENINIWKISLGDSQNSEDEYLYDYCIKHNKILLGFGEGIDFSQCKNRDEIAKKLNDSEKYSYPPTALNTLKNKIKKDDIVLVSYGNKKLRAIGKVTEDYQYLDDDNLKTYVQSRGVEWLLIPEEPFSYEKILKKQFSQ